MLSANESTWLKVPLNYPYREEQFTKNKILAIAGQRSFFCIHITHSTYIAHLIYDTKFNDDASGFICIIESIFESCSISHAF